MEIIDEVVYSVDRPDTSSCSSQDAEQATWLQNI